MFDEDSLQFIIEEFDPTGEWEAGYYGDTLICPCGDEIELDGVCPQGCVSILRRYGLI